MTYKTTNTHILSPHGGSLTPGGSFARPHSSTNNTSDPNSCLRGKMITKHEGKIRAKGKQVGVIVHDIALLKKRKQYGQLLPESYIRHKGGL